MTQAVSRRAFLKGVAAGTVAVSALPLGFHAWGQPTLRAGFVYLTSPGDAGWTFRHDEGRKFAAARLEGVELITAVAENVSDADAERVVRTFASQGFDITFATSFGFMDGTLAVANDFPDLKFEHCSGFKTAPNMGNYFGRMYQARYLSGIVAGLMTRTNVLGYVAAIPIPEVIRIANAFYLGAKRVNPDVTMRVVGLGSFFDPPKARELALALIDQGADVVTMHEDTPAVPQAAQDRGVFSVSYQSDMSRFAPNSHITGVFWNWGPYYLQTLELVRDGTWTSREIWSGFENEEGFVEPLVGISNEEGGGESGLINEVLIAQQDGPQKVQQILDELEKAQAELAASTLKGRDVVFGGPLKNAAGELVYAEGEVPSDEDLLSMTFAVEGVSGPGFFSS